MNSTPDPTNQYSEDNDFVFTNSGGTGYADRLETDGWHRGIIKAFKARNRDGELFFTSEGKRYCIIILKVVGGPCDGQEHLENIPIDLYWKMRQFAVACGIDAPANPSADFKFNPADFAGQEVVFHLMRLPNSDFLNVRLEKGTKIPPVLSIERATKLHEENVIFVSNLNAVAPAQADPANDF